MNNPDKLSEQDIESLERATIAAVSPEAFEELDGWLLAFDSGTVDRARSAVPLKHQPPPAGQLALIEARYAARGLPPKFRLADVPSLEAFRLVLSQRGYQAGKPSQVQTGSVQRMVENSGEAPAELSAAPDAAWAALFLGEGFDPVDGASRVKSLSKAAGSSFASVREAGQTVAAGAGAFSHGWASVHGMRTALAWRGKGMAGRVLTALAQEAKRRNMERVFLQVEDSSTAALALYKRAGFSLAWRYRYWSKPV